MALIPRALRPGRLIRRKAMYSGFLGNSGFWKIVGVVVFGKSTLAKFFGKNPELVDVASLGPGRFMEVATARPLTRRRRRKLRKRGVETISLDEQRALSRLWADRAAAAKAAK